MKSSIRAASVTAFAAILVTGHGRPAVAKVVAEIVDWGESAGSRSTEEAGPRPGESGLSPSRPMTKLRYLARSDRIEARLCGNFGMTVRLSGGPADSLPNRVSVRVLHPPFTRPDGATSTEDTYSSDMIEGQTNVGFTFDHAWEMQPGEWTIVVAARGVELTRKSFTITASPAGSQDTACGPGT